MRDVAARYRRSWLGLGWAVLQPLVLMVLFSLLRNFISIPSDGLPYMVFSYTALIPWTFLTSSIHTCGSSIISNATVIKKVAIPREVFPLAAVVTALFDMIIAGLILAGMLFWFRIEISWNLLWLPALILLTAGLAFGAGMFVAGFGTFRHDFILLTPFVLQGWLYLTPVIYPLSAVPEGWRTLYALNPMVGLIEGFRNVILQASPPPITELSYSAGVIVLMMMLAWPLFRWLSQYFADVL